MDYIPILNEAYKNKILMFCANPDFETVIKVNKKFIIHGRHEKSEIRGCSDV